jgi:hypothetical protein
MFRGRRSAAFHSRRVDRNLISSAPFASGRNSFRRGQESRIMVRRWTSDRELDEKTFRHKVDVPVPQGGLGRQLEEMVGWCHGRAALWALHGRGSGDRRSPPRGYARFYFVEEPTAAAFAEAWVSCGARRAADGAPASQPDDGPAPRQRRAAPTRPR